MMRLDIHTCIIEAWQTILYVNETKSQTNEYMGKLYRYNNVEYRANKYYDSRE